MTEPTRRPRPRGLWPLVALLSWAPATRGAEADAVRPSDPPAPPDTTAVADADTTRPPAVSPTPPTVVVYERTPDEGMDAEEIERLIWPDLDDLEPRYEIEDREGKTLRFGFTARYDRVDELSARFSQAFDHHRSHYPRIALTETYSTGRDQWLYRLEFEQPIIGERRLAVGASVFDETAVFTDLVGRVGDGENTLAALFFREDFRHYFSREGIAAYVALRLPAGPSLRIGYVNEDHEPLTSTTNGSIFRPRTSFRDNPRADEGRLRAWSATAGYETISSRRSTGLDQRHTLTIETSSPSRGSDFDFERWVLESRASWRLSVDQDLTLRVRGGGVMSGELPLQSAFFLGGIGTLRAHEYGELVGERAYLLNAEYGFSVYRQIQAVIFHDLGAVWSRPTSIGDTRPELDVGLGLRNRSGRFRINVARDLRAHHAPLVATVRLTQPF